MEGLKTVVDIYAEQTGNEGTAPQSGKICRYELLCNKARVEGDWAANVVNRVFA